jgi:hypothetical protein
MRTERDELRMNREQTGYDLPSNKLRRSHYNNRPRVEPRGFEPLTSAVQRRHSPKHLRSYHAEIQACLLSGF